MKFKPSKSTVVLVPEDYFYEQLKRKSKARSHQLSSLLVSFISADDFDDFIDDVVRPDDKQPPKPGSGTPPSPPKEPVFPTREVRVQLRKGTFRKAKLAARDSGIDVSRLLTLVVNNIADRS